ncbi:MAG: hypothetical protein F6K19_26460 [Cyanothece sp. SIO1E1]|nr:hypothetical protein [Cyanothece sp. SIO1E1]
MFAIKTLYLWPVEAADKITIIQGGNALVQRASGRVETVREGRTLQPGELVFPRDGAIVIIRCDSGNIRSRRYLFGLSDVCPDSVVNRHSLNGRGEDDFLQFLFKTFDYATQVLDANPLLVWNSFEEITEYQVQVFQGDTLIWEDMVQDTHLTYSGVPLEMGQRYQLIITAIDSQNTEHQSRLLFRRLSAAEIKQVQAAIVHLNTQPLAPEVRAIALSRIYLDVAKPLTDPPEGAGLVMETIPQLEALVNSGNQTASLHQLLGDLYLQIGLLEKAQMQYDHVLELTSKKDDLRSRASAWLGLANIAAANSEHSLAAQRLQFAQINQAEIGDSNQVDQINTWLEKLELR